MPKAAQAPKSERLQKLEQRQEKLKRALAKEKARLRQDERKDDTRRKILDGALIQEYAKDHPEQEALLQKLRRERLTRDNDRALFDLPPLKEKAS